MKEPRPWPWTRPATSSSKPLWAPPPSLAPKAWQVDAAGRHQPVACRYVLTGRTLTFALGAYDKSRALTIDPTVQFSTLTGSTADNWGFTATYDDAGNMYSGGIVFNSGGTFPATPGPTAPRSAAGWTWPLSSTIPPCRDQQPGCGPPTWAATTPISPQPCGK
ncbi:DUF7948 domain-containing protein [Hymenobacter humi]